METTMKDELNPAFVFQQTNTELLLQIVRGEISAVELARQGLASRGLGWSGQWIGDKQAKNLWSKTAAATDRNGRRILVTIPE